MGFRNPGFRNLYVPALALCLAAAVSAQTPAESPAGLTGKGGGAFIKSDDGRGIIRFMGYTQPTFVATTKSQHQLYKETNFLVRRARADFKAEYDSLYTLFFEYDAAPSTGTSLIEAYTQAALIRDRVNFRIGKYIQPFSAENLRSSRALATVERFQALNAVIGLPGYDAQIGAMLWGNIDASKMFKYYLSVTDGNASASMGGNLKDTNGVKDVIGRLEFSPMKEFKAGVGLDYDKEYGQSLAMKSYSGATFVTTRVAGIRRGVDLDAHALLGKFALDAEWLLVDFPDTSRTIHGGYLQGSMWAMGSEAEGGLEPVVRLEYSMLSAKGQTPDVDGAVMTTTTLGVNYWANQWVRWQTDLIAEMTTGKGNAAYLAADDGRVLPTLMSQLQIKF